MCRLAWMLAVVLVVVVLALVAGCGGSAGGVTSGGTVSAAGKPPVATAPYAIVPLDAVGGQFPVTIPGMSGAVSNGVPRVVTAMGSWLVPDAGSPTSGALSPLPGAASSSGRDITLDGGKVVGLSSDGTTSQACTWQVPGGAAEALIAPTGAGQSLAVSISRNGQYTAGKAEYPYTDPSDLNPPLTAVFRAALWSGSGSPQDLGVLTSTTLPAPAANDSWANGVNNSGWVVGESGRTAWYGDPAYPPGYHQNYSCRGFIWKGSAMEELLPLTGVDPYYSTSPYAINNVGQAVGLSGQSAVIWENGSRVATLLPLPSRVTTYPVGVAKAINDSGQVVGWFGILTGDSRAAIWSKNSKGKYVCTDLNTQIPAGSGWVLTRAMSIGNTGWIGCAGTLNNVKRACLLKPTS
jgi:probable HAF family extracellular repeat protein